MVASGHELLKTLRLDLLALLFFQIFRYGFTQRLASSQHRQQQRHLNYLCTRGRVPHHTTTPATAGEGRGRGLLARIWGRTRRGRKGSSYGRETGGTTFPVVCSIWICADWRSSLRSNSV